MNAERIQQLADWYGDPMRTLPRKVVNDVANLIHDVEKAREALAAIAALLHAAEPEAKATHLHSAQAESCPAPKMNDDERQCDRCGRVYHESEVSRDVCWGCRGFKGAGGAP